MYTEIKLFLITFFITGVIVFLLNFIQILRFKWYIDYYNMIDAMCNTKSWTKYEVESMRYNLYSFLYNIHDKTFLEIYNNYVTTYGTFISFYWLFIGILTYAFRMTGGILMSWIVYAFVLIIGIVYTIVNSILLAKFKKLHTNIAQNDNYLNRYQNVYRILNAIILFSNLKEVELEFNLDELNESPMTLDKIIENNIGSYENLSSVSKIRNIKLQAYKRLDFVKYLVLNPTSPFFLKYFNNIYARLPDTSTYQYDVSENIYLNYLFSKDIDIELIKIVFIKMQSLLEQNTEQYYKEIYKEVSDFLEITSDTKEYVNSIRNCYESIQKIFSSNESTLNMNSKVFEDMKTHLQKIKDQLEKNQYKDIYADINRNIGNTLGNENAISVPNNNYIQYFLDNRDVLFDVYDKKTPSYYEIINTVNDIGNYIYAYLVYFAIVFFLLAHYIYANVNNTEYAFVMVALVCIYIFALWSYGNYSFILQSR